MSHEQEILSGPEGNRGTFRNITLGFLGVNAIGYAYSMAINNPELTEGMGKGVAIAALTAAAAIGIEAFNTYRPPGYAESRQHNS